MKEHLEKELKRYVIATFDNPTNYVVCDGKLHYSFIDNVQLATKFTSKRIAEEIFKTVSERFKIDVVIVPLSIKYVLLEEDE